MIPHRAPVEEHASLWQNTEGRPGD